MLYKGRLALWYTTIRQPDGDPRLAADTFLRGRMAPVLLAYCHGFEKAGRGHATGPSRDFGWAGSLSVALGDAIIWWADEHAN